MQIKDCFTASLAALILMIASSADASTWINGSKSINQLGIYGEKGVPSLTNVPGARSYSVSFKDSQNNLWLFGGEGWDSSGNMDLLNDLWKWDGSQWTWVDGNDIVDYYGVYGMKGVPAALNNPGSRQESVSWVDHAGNFWIFGGKGFGASGLSGSLNDLWKFDPVSTQWTWVSGSTARNQNGSYGTKGSGSTTTVPGARYWSNSWVDVSGNLWLFGGYGRAATGGTDGFLNDLWKFDGTNWTWVSGPNSLNQFGVYGAKGTPAPTNLPGARAKYASWTDGSGNFWLFGGRGFSSSGGEGWLNDLWRFDGANWTWVGGPNSLNQSGISGAIGVPDPNNIPSSRDSGTGWTDAAGNFWLLGGSGISLSGTQGLLNDLWKFDGITWIWVNGSNFADQTGAYGSIGIPATTNFPGGRQGAVSWLDPNNILLLFGGFGYPATSSTQGYLNDLWKLGAGSAPRPVSNDYVVGAYYYPWYENNSFHYSYPKGSTTLIYHLNPQMTPQLGWYDQTDADISQHFKWAKYAGISFFVTSYWGLGSGEDNTTRLHMFNNPDRGNIKLAVFLEPGITPIDHPETPDTITTQTNYLCDNYFNQDGYFRIDNKPVIFIYVTRAMTNDNLSMLLNTIRTAASNKGFGVYIVGDHVWRSPNITDETPRISPMDAVTNYDIYGNLSSTPYVTDSALDIWQSNNSAWKSFVNGLGKQFIPAVSPGFNDRGVRTGHDACSRKLNNESGEFGSLFSAMLDRARSSVDSKKMLMITSWNEWHEDTQIEPVTTAPAINTDDSGNYYTQGLYYNGYGMLYLDILRHKLTAIPSCDFDDDGAVGFNDLAYLLTYWLETCETDVSCLKADFTSNGMVNFADFAQCAESWGQPKTNVECDFDSDGRVGFDDIAYVLTYWLETCGTDANCLKADLVSNGLINLADFSVCAQSWTGQ